MKGALIDLLIKISYRSNAVHGNLWELVPVLHLYITSKWDFWRNLSRICKRSVTKVSREHTVFCGAESYSFSLHLSASQPSTQFQGLFPHHWSPVPFGFLSKLGISDDTGTEMWTLCRKLMETDQSFVVVAATTTFWLLSVLPTVKIFLLVAHKLGKVLGKVTESMWSPVDSRAGC